MRADWTDEKIETLKRLWTDGLSASQIASEIGGVTRNAVIGKVHRLGLTRGRAVSSSSQTKVGDKISTTTPSRRRHSNSQSRRKAVQRIEDDKIDVPPAKKLKLEELNSDTCKWPHGHPTDPHPAFHFCGLTVVPGKTYCPYHDRLSHAQQR